MAGFDKEKDKVLRTYTKIPVPNGGFVACEAYCYNGGPVKLQLTRETASESGNGKRAKLGRITSDEARELAVVLELFVKEADKLKEGQQ